MSLTGRSLLAVFTVALAAGAQEPARTHEAGAHEAGAREAGTREAGKSPQEEAARPQDDEALRGEIETLVITASRRWEREIDVPRGMNVVTRRQIRDRGVLSVADALDDQSGVWVEKRTAHTSDLVIRGLSGGNLLALVDGNTLSTFWGEGGFAGDDMYGKVDPEILDRIEVVRGPASVLYGSNALGAVVNFVTRSSPFDFTDGGVVAGSRTRVVAGTAPSMWRFRQEFYGASENVRWLVGGSSWEAGGTRDGGGQDQRPTGGDGWFGDARLDWRVDDTALFTLTLQHTENLHVFRYYRPHQDNSNRRTAVAATLALEDLDWGFADEAVFKLYVQHKRDERRWFDGATGARTATGVARWATVQAGAQFGKIVGEHELVYGIDFQTTDGESPDDEQFTVTPVGGTAMKAAPDSLWSSLGIYGQDTWSVADWLSLVGSVRFDVLRLETDVDALYTPPGGLDPGVDEFTDHEIAIVGGLQAVFHVGDDTNLYGGWTRGFRQFAPKFGVSQHGFGVVVPSRFLDPVTADQFEIGVKHGSPHLRIEAAAYYTRFRNFQNVVRGTYMGLDWFDFNGDGTRDADEDVFVTEGNGKAYVYGLEVYASMNLALVDEDFFGDSWTLGAGFMWNYGGDTTNDIPLRHTHPARGLLSLRYDHPDPDLGLWLEASAEFVRHYDRIPPSRLSGDVGYLEDPQDPGSGMRRSWGLPGYTVVDFRGGFQPCDNATVTFGVDNVFDKLYRPAHARWDAPGRNVWVSVEITF